MEQSIAEMWRSPLYEDLRARHLAGRWNDVKICENCQDWQHMRWDHGFEKAINKVLGKD